MVGEVRDTETAQLTIHAALTGHIVLSTLHTNNSIGVLPRLVDMKVDSFLIPYSVNLMLAQRLVGQLCVSCKKAEALAPQLEAIIKKELEKLPASAKTKVKEMKAYHASGCKTCKGKGVTGRVALFEVLQMTPELRAIVASGSTEAKIFEEAKRQGMITLRQDGILKALEGMVSVEEVLKETTEL